MTKRTQGTIDQARSGFTVTPSDDDTLIDDPGNTKYQWEEATLFIGTGGDLKVTLADDDTPVTYKNLPDGCDMPIVVKKVWDTDTTCTDIVAQAK